MAHYTLIASPGMESLAADVLKTADDSLVQRATYRFANFKDGTPDVSVKPEDVMGKNVVLLADYDLPGQGANWLSTLAVIYCVPRYGAKSFNVIMPFFPVGTMERVSTEGEVATAATFCRMLSATPMTEKGPVRFTFYDIHALQERFYFADQVLPVLHTALSLVAKRFLSVIPEGDVRVGIAFPDDGAKKRFEPFFKSYGMGREYAIIVCSKVREGTKRFLKLTEGREDVKDSHILIVDDLIQSGGTMRNCKDLLFSEGAKSVYGYCTHGIFPGDSWTGFQPEAEAARQQKPFTKFWVTNSIAGLAEKLEGKSPFECLSLAPVICEHLKKAIIP